MPQLSGTRVSIYVQRGRRVRGRHGAAVHCVAYSFCSLFFKRGRKKSALLYTHRLRSGDSPFAFLRTASTFSSTNTPTGSAPPSLAAAAISWHTGVNKLTRKQSMIPITLARAPLTLRLLCGHRMRPTRLAPAWAACTFLSGPFYFPILYHARATPPLVA